MTPNPSAHGSRVRRRAGFTLIELLVVVTLIVILIALLAPALERAMGLAESVRCAATLKVQTIGMAQYAMDHRRRAILQMPYRPNDWWHRLAPYCGAPNFARAPLVNTGNYRDDQSPPFMDCPSTHEEIDFGGGLMGTRDEAWGNDYTMGSYGLNLWLADYPDYNAEFPNHYGRYIDAPGATPLTGDSIWFGGWPDENDAPTMNYATGDSNHTKGFQMNRWVINRHGFAVNMCFVDGSASSVRLGELWGLPWYRGYRGAPRDLPAP